MSVPNNSMTIKEWFEYGRHVATTLSTIGHTTEANHFARIRFPELQTAAFDNLVSPALLFETPERRGIDNSSSNLLTTMYMGFTIAIRIEDGTDADAVLNAELDAETIALQVIARMRHDRIHKSGLVFADVKMNEWEGDTVTPFLKNNWAGYRIAIPVEVNDARLRYNPGLWSDDNAAPLMIDVSGVSCPNLNDPSLGLSATQRLNCLLPTYNFASNTTLAALTDQQEADLIEAFGNEGGTCEPVTILDQDDNTLASVASGGEYTVFVFDEIVDDGGDGDDEVVDLDN